MTLKCAKSIPFQKAMALFKPSEWKNLLQPQNLKGLYICFLVWLYTQLILYINEIKHSDSKLLK